MCGICLFTICKCALFLVCPVLLDEHNFTKMGLHVLQIVSVALQREGRALSKPALFII